MIQIVRTALKKLMDFFVVTETPKTKVEPLFDTGSAGGMCYRLIDPSGDSRVVFVLQQTRRDEETGEKVAVTDLASPVTEYRNIQNIDHKNLGAHGRPRVDYTEIADPLTFEDHETLVEYFEGLAQNAELAKNRKIIRRYPSTPKGKTVPAAQKPAELKL